jgi:hypothetical protein
MMGPKKLSEIRAELKQALAKESDNPIQWLEKQIQELQQKNKVKPVSTRVLEALLHLLESEPKKRRKRRAAGSGRK